MRKKKALIFGSAGQDGRLLEDLLTRLDYIVVGVDIAKVSSSDGTKYSVPNFSLHGDVRQFIDLVRPDEIYHLAAVHSSAQESLGQIEELCRRSFEVNTLTLFYLLEAMKSCVPQSRLFYAATSHVFGQLNSQMQSESSRMEPDSVYGITKFAGVMACRMYREQGIHATAGILYNHESNLRPRQFLSMKIVRAAVEIYSGSQDQLILGDLSAVADWGYAPDYVKAMHELLSSGKASDYIIATGEAHSVKEFVQIAFERLGLDWTKYTTEDRSLLQRTSPVRIGDATRLRQGVGWKPTMTFKEMVHHLVETEALERGVKI